MEKACYLLVLFTRFCYTIVSSREATLHYLWTGWFQNEAGRWGDVFHSEALAFQKEVEQLREKLTGSTEDAAQSVYTSRVQEMQDQIQSMQV